MAALDSLFDFADSCAEEYHIDKGRLYAVRLVLEELFTNLVKYDPTASPKIPINFDKSGGRLIIRLINENGACFDVSRTTSADIDSPLQDRRVGGLGLHLVKNMVDDFRYEFADGTGIITVVISLEEERV